MAAVSSGDVFFVGSVPLGDTEEVLRTCAAVAGGHVFALPDGELGPRQKWIGALAQTSYSSHPDLEAVPSDAGFSTWAGGAYRLRDGVHDTTFDNLPYADAAIDSYATFRRLREQGEIPDGVRFQVAVPTPHGGVAGYFPDVSQWPAAMAAYTRGLQVAFARMLEVIPACDLAIQLDYCTELVDMAGDTLVRMRPWNPPGTQDERFERHTAHDYIAPLSEGLPDDVLLGYHLCYGTFPVWPNSDVEDLGLVVRVANRLVEQTPRRVDFLHLPSMPDSRDAFFAPLRDLRAGDARIFLGLECADGVEALVERADSARRALPAFGISHYCGYGRDEAQRLPGLLDDLRAGAEALRGR